MRQYVFNKEKGKAKRQNSLKYENFGTAAT